GGTKRAVGSRPPNGPGRYKTQQHQTQRQIVKKHLKILSALLCAGAMMATVSIVSAADDEPCCKATIKAGKKCKHECCVKAAEAGKVCEKCHPKKDEKK